RSRRALLVRASFVSCLPRLGGNSTRIVHFDAQRCARSRTVDAAARGDDSASIMNRRNFLKSTAVGAFALAAALAFLGAQDKTETYTVALIGCGWWGGNIVGAALASKRCKLVAMCDVDQNQIARCSKEIAHLTSDTPKHYSDFRECIAKEKPQI